jgi:hypothetical protein
LILGYAFSMKVLDFFFQQMQRREDAGTLTGHVIVFT